MRFSGAIVYITGGKIILAERYGEYAQIVAEFVSIENNRNQICYSFAIGKNTQDTYIGLNYAKSSKIHYIEVIRMGKKMMF